jgi:hypothetical protein
MRLFCKILAGTLNKDNIEDRHYAEDFLYFVEDLTLADIIVGLEIYKSQINKPDHFDAESQDKNELKFVTESGWDKLEEHSPVKGLDRRIALHKLSAAGLIKEVVGVYLSYTGGKYIMTPMFQKLINFIHLRANDPLFSSMIPDSRD